MLKQSQLGGNDLLFVRHLGTLLYLQQFTQSVRLSLVYFIETEHPGYLGAQDMYYVGTIKG
jgi:hypothetical protein